MNIQNLQHLDSVGCIDDLRDALADPALQDVAPDGPACLEAAKAAYQFALSLGRCRLSGTSPGDGLPNVLPAHLAIAAERALADDMPEWTEKANRLGEGWDSA